MVRTIITISEKDKAWLDQYSRRHHQSTAETIRLAIHEFRKAQRPATLTSALEETRGMWASKKQDGLKQVEKLRGEWGR